MQNLSKMGCITMNRDIYVELICDVFKNPDKYEGCFIHWESFMNGILQVAKSDTGISVSEYNLMKKFVEELTE